MNESDPKSMMRWVKRMGQEIGQDLSEDFDRMVAKEMEKSSHPSDKLSTHGADSGE